MAYKAASSNAASDNTPTVPVPTGAAADDIAVIVIASDDTGWDLSQGGGLWPAGFQVFLDVNVTLDGESVGAAWKRLTGADTGSYTFGTMSSSNEWAAGCVLLDGRATGSDPVASSAASSSAGNTSPVTATANGVTAVAGDDLVYVVGHDVQGSALNYGSSTAPANFTSRVDVELGPQGWASVFIATRDNVSAGATGSVAGSFTLAGGAAGWAAGLLRVPASSGTDATVTAVPADAAVDAPLGTISAGSAVTGVVSDATADAPAGAPTASAGTDDFDTRANGTLDAPWMAWYSAAMPTITSGVAYAGVAAGSSANATYAVATDSADTMTEGVFETALTPGNVESFIVGARLTAHSSAADGYFFQLSDEAPAGTGTSIRPRLYAGDGFSVLATGTNITSSAIDAMRIEVIGDEITGYARISGVWTSVVSATDSTYTAAGYPGFSVRQPTGAAPDNGFEEVSWGLAAGTDATVTAVPAVAAADAPVGVLSAGSTVTGVVATALADAPPANQIISAVVNAPAVVAAADAPAGVISEGGDRTVTAVPAVAGADAPAGVVSAGAQVAGVVADAAADAPAGVVSGGATVAGVVAGATADAPRAGLSPDPGSDEGSGSVAVTFAEGVQ